jgi:PAS domain S-box-containing protein
MRTPSLTRRVTLTSLAVLVAVVAGSNLFIYLTLRRTLMHNLHDVLATRANLVRAESDHFGPQELASRLTELGVRATITAPDGRTFEARPPSPSLDQGLAPRPTDLGEHPASRVVTLPGGGRAVVFVRRTGTDDALSRLLLFEGLGTVIALIVAGLLLRRISVATLRPVEEIAAAARRAAAGRRGERLRPDRPATPLGELATAYDLMLDDLEAAIHASQKAQSRSESLYRHTRMILDTAQQAFVAMDTRGRILDWNMQAEKLFGWRRDEVLGSTVAETLVPPSLRQQHLDGLARLLATGEGPFLGKRVEIEAMHRSGSTIPVELAVWATENEALTFNALIEDVRDRRKGEEAISQLAAIVESARDAILSQSLDGTIRSWNHSAELLYGYTAAEAIGQPVSIVVPPEEAATRAKLIEEVRRGRPIQTLETVRRCKNGTLVDVALTVSPVLNHAGAVVGISTMARDITEQRWMARTLDDTLAALEVALEQARHSEARSRRFLADAAHQLRSPITGIRACTETLLRGAPEPQRDRLMMHLVREASRASRLLGGLLRLARLDRGDDLAPEPSDLVALCEGEAERARALAPHLDVVVDADGCPMGAADLDPGAVEEILGNLLDNARRHAVGRIGLLIRGSGETLEVRVTDDGPGMTGDEAERAFERFVSLDGRGGSGLGLPIAQTLARAHGGELTYEEHGDKAFVLRLPLSADAHDVTGNGHVEQAPS